MASGYGPRGDARPKLTKIADGVPPGALNRRAATHRGGSLLLGHEGRGALIAASPSLSRNRDVLDMLKSAQKETRSTESLTTAWSPRYQQNRTLSGEVGRPISSLARDYSEHGVSSPLGGIYRFRLSCPRTARRLYAAFSPRSANPYFDSFWERQRLRSIAKYARVNRPTSRRIGRAA